MAQEFLHFHVLSAAHCLVMKMGHQLEWVQQAALANPDHTFFATTVLAFFSYDFPQQFLETPPCLLLLNSSPIRNRLLEPHTLQARVLKAGQAL